MSSIPGINIGIGGTSLGCGLTSDQIRDCYKANRSPRTGRRLRVSKATELEKRSKIVNWNKLMVEGAARNLQKVARDLCITSDELMSLEKAIIKIRTMMTNKLAEDYEAFKATELFERNKDKLDHPSNGSREFKHYPY